MLRFFLAICSIAGLLGGLCAQDIVLFEHEEVNVPNALLDNHVSSLYMISEDSLLCVWFGGKGEGSVDNRILSSYSVDSGASWNAPKTIFDSQSDTLFRDPHLHFNGNKLVLMFNVQVGNGSIISAQENYLAYSVSNDNGKSWSTYNKIDVNSSAGAIRIVTPFNDAIKIDGVDAFGVHWREEGKTTTHVSILLADFDKDSFQLRGDISSNYRLAEPALIEFGNELIIYLRTDQGFIQYSTSNDMGYSWSNPVNTSLSAPYALSAIKKVNEDSLLIVWNNDRNTRNYLSAAICGKSDLSDLTYRHLINVKQSPSGQVSYPSVVMSSDGHYLMTYTNRKDFGRDSLNRLIVRGDIHFHRFTWKEAERIFSEPFPVATLTAPQFVNDIIEIEDRIYYCGNNAFLSILNKSYDSVASIPLIQTPYDLNRLAWDSNANALICVGNGGWYVRYLIDQELVSHQKRFDELGAYNLQAILADDSGHYVVNLNGDLGQIKNPDEPALKLWNMNGLSQKQVFRNEKNIQTCGQNLSITRFEESTQKEEYLNLAQNSVASFEAMKEIGAGRVIVCGERGALALQISDSVIFPFNLPNEFIDYNYIEIEEVSDSLLLIITNQDMVLLVNTYSFNTLGIRLLPDNQIGRKILNRKNDLHIVTETGRVYSFSKIALLEMFKEKFNPPNPSSIIPLNSDNLCVYPNPANSFICIKSEYDILDVTVFSLDGRECELDYSNDFGLTRLSLSKLAFGIYMVKVELSNLETKNIWFIHQ